METSALSPEANGMSVVIETILGRTYHYLTFGEDEPAALSNMRLSVLPDFARGRRRQLSEHVFAWAR